MFTPEAEALLKIAYQAYGKGLRKANAITRALFEATQDAFDSLHTHATVDSYFVCNLAACAVIALDYDHDTEIPWHDVMYDDVLERTVDGFLRTILIAHQANKLRFDASEDAYYMNAFRMPSAFIRTLERYARSMLCSTDKLSTR